MFKTIRCLKESTAILGYERIAPNHLMRTKTMYPKWHKSSIAANKPSLVVCIKQSNKMVINP